jgi:hypothetical protein
VQTVITFQNIQRFLGVRGKGRDGGRTTGAEDLPLDHRLTFKPEADEHWTFEEGRGLLLNGEDVRTIVRDAPNDVRTLCGVSQGLDDYQQFVWARGGKDKAAFNGAVGALQHAIVGRLGSLYEGLTGGLHVEWTGEDFWINNVNVRAVVKLFALRPTDAGRRYLEGLQQKLDLILSRRRLSRKDDAVAAEAKRLHDEISVVLQCVPSTSHPRLCA